MTDKSKASFKPEFKLNEQTSLSIAPTAVNASEKFMAATSGVQINHNLTNNLSTYARAGATHTRAFGTPFRQTTPNFGVGFSFKW